MDPNPASHNVVTLKPAPRQAELMLAMRAAALQTLSPIASAVLAGADDALFDLVQKSHSAFEQQQYFEAMRELRRHRNAIEQRHREHFIAAFAALEKRKPLVAHYAQPGETSNELSLLDEDELEEQLASEQVAQAVERRHGVVLAQLDSQFGQMAGGLVLNGMLNPIGPGHLAAALRAGLRGCDLAPSARLVLFKLYEQALLPALTPFYADLHQRLSAAGVIAVVSKAAPANAPAPAPESIAPASSRKPESSGRDDLFAALHGLLEDYRAAQRAAGYAQSRSDVPPLGAAEALSMLTALQRDLPPSMHAAAADPKQSLSGQIKLELQAQAVRSGVGRPGAPLAPAEEDAVDLVGMLFEVLLNERKFQDQVRGTFTQLILPFVKVAMLDRHMFMNKSHPARRMLNAVAEACDGNRGETPLERELLERVEQLVNRLVAEFNEDIAIFETLQEEFNAFLDQHRKRVELAERRAAEAQRGRERLEQARAVAAMELAMLMGAREAPSAISDLLRRYWTHHLALVILRDGTESERFAQARRSGEALWQIMLECESGQPRRAELGPLLEPVLASSGLSGRSATETIHTVEALLDAMYRGDRSRIESASLPVAARPEEATDPGVAAEAAAFAAPLPDLPTAPPPISNVVRLRAPSEAVEPPAASPWEAAADLPARPVVTERGTSAHFAAFWGDEAGTTDAATTDAANTDTETASSDAIVSQEPPHTESEPDAAAAAPTPPAAAPGFDPADLEKIRKLEVGHWVELIGDDGVPQPAKLSWVSPISNRLLFVNRRGMRVCALTAEELAVMLGQGKVSLREIDSAFERAMSQVLGKLRDTQGQARTRPDL